MRQLNAFIVLLISYSIVIAFGLFLTQYASLLTRVVVVLMLTLSFGALIGIVEDYVKEQEDVSVEQTGKM